MPEILLNAHPAAPIVLALVSVSLLVTCDFGGFTPGRYLFKPLAALMFIWLALIQGALSSDYGHWLLAGLLCCLLGDLFLMPDHAGSFLAGLVAFLTGHLLYTVAFIFLGSNWQALLLGAVPALLLLGLSTRWLMPHVPTNMKKPVLAYIAVITGMLISACLTLDTAAGWVIVCGAWGFALSDLAVARQRFVTPDRINGLWGTPLYFGSQMVLAATPGLL